MRLWKRQPKPDQRPRCKTCGAVLDADGICPDLEDRAEINR